MHPIPQTPTTKSKFKIKIIETPPGYALPFPPALYKPWTNPQALNTALAKHRNEKRKKEMRIMRCMQNEI